MKISIQIAIWFMLISSCGSDVSDVIPELKNGIDQITNDISSEISFTKLSIQSSKHESTGDRTFKDLTVILTGAKVKSFTTEKLELLSKHISSIIKQNVINITDFDLVNIIYETDDGSQVSDSTDHTIYVFRPHEIK